MPITNQVILNELVHIKVSITDLKDTQAKQGKQILDILLNNAKIDGQKEEKKKIISLRSNDKFMFWTMIASLATTIGVIIAAITLVIIIIPKGVTQ